MGDVREDGYIFSHMSRGKEAWLSPKAYHYNRLHKILHTIKVRTKRMGLPFDLTIDHLVEIYPEDNKCPALGINLEWGQKNGRRSSPSLDRIIPDKGYVIGNVVFVSWLANTVKSDLSLDQLRGLVAFYEDLNARKRTH